MSKSSGFLEKKEFYLMTAVLSFCLFQTSQFSLQISELSAHNCVSQSFINKPLYIYTHIKIHINSGSWWWTGRPGMLQSMGLQRVGHDWASELHWTDQLHFPRRCCYGSPSRSSLFCSGLPLGRLHRCHLKAHLYYHPNNFLCSLHLIFWIHCSLDPKSPIFAHSF